MNHYFKEGALPIFAYEMDQNVNTLSNVSFNNVICETPIVDRYEDVVVNPFATSLGPNLRPPTLTKIMDDGAGSTGVYNWAFDEKKEEELFFNLQLPHSWKEGTPIMPHVHFCTPTQTATTITWGLEYMWKNINSVYGNTTIISQATNTPPAYQHTIGSIGTISGVGQKISSILMCRLFRAASGYVGNAYLLSVDFHINVSTIGSGSETSK